MFCLQNKNNTVLKLPAWLMAMGYFKSVNFIFLIVGHTKNVADHLFNSLKQDYQKKNIFTFDKLVQTLDKSMLVTIHSSVAEDFLDSNKLLDSLFWSLVVNIKKNHIFLVQTTVCRLRSGRAISRSIRSMSSTFGRRVHRMESFVLS